MQLVWPLPGGQTEEQIRDLCTEKLYGNGVAAQCQMAANLTLGNDVESCVTDIGVSRDDANCYGKIGIWYNW